jgi:Homeodomain-like domain-containing protein
MNDEFFWLAGLLEGEGSFGRGPSSQPNLPHISVQMTDEDVIQRVSSIWGVRYFKHSPPVAHYKPCFAAKIRGEKAVEWMIRLRPHMGTRRQSQIDKAVSSYQVVPSYSQEHPTFSRKRVLELHAEGLTYRAIASRMGCHHSLIGKILNRSMPG